MKKYAELVPNLDFETFFSFIHLMHDEVFVYDASYRIVYTNQASQRNYGCSPEDMIGKSFFDFDSRNWWSTPILPVVYREKKPYAIRQKMYVTGHELLTIAVPLLDEQGNVRYVVMNKRDQLQDIDIYNAYYINGHKGKDDILAPIAESEEMKPVMALLERLSSVDVTCILSGESGTGKSMLAKYMHSKSPRKDKPFIGLNCANIPTDLLESELFGYARGAFTGANATGKKGLLESAHTGTLLLDEVSELPLSAQAKLLQFLQEQEFIPVGGSGPVHVDVRIIAATNRNLKAMVKNRQFREDLFYRLHVVDICIPPLRKHKQDIPFLAHHFLRIFNEKYGVTHQFSENALALLMDYDWPGNIRELQHLIENIVITEDLQIIDSIILPLKLADITENDALPFPPNGGTLREKLECYESNLVNEAYRKYGSSRKVAHFLGISQSKANNLLRKYAREDGTYPLKNRFLGTPD